MLGVPAINGLCSLILSDNRIPTHVWLEAKIRELGASGQGVYVLQRGEKNDGQVLLKLSDCRGQARLLIRQRDLMTNELQWMNALVDETMPEQKADDYISRARGRDPDLWVIEVEDQEMNNPFEP